MRRARHVGRQAAVVVAASLMVSLGLAGCLATGSVNVPAFRIGDLATYADGTRMMVTGFVTVQYPDEDEPRRVLELVVERPGDPRANTTHVRVDPATGHAIEATTRCAHYMEDRCWQNLTETWFAREWGVPWGYGSSLFAGLKLDAGDVFERSFATHHGPARIAFSVTDVFEEDGERRARVAASPVEPLPANATVAWLSGSFVVGERSPFVVGLDATLPDLEDGRGPTVRVVKQMQRVDHAAGSSAVDVPATGTQGVTPWEAGGTMWAVDSNIPPGTGFWFERLDGSFDEALDYALENGLVEEESDVIRMSMAHGGSSATGPANATVTETERTVYSVWVQTSATEVTDYEIVRENRSQAGGLLDEAVFEHRVDSRYEGVGARVAYGHVLGLDAAAQVIESKLPYATQYVSVGPQPDGIFQTANGPSPMVYTFSWWHNMQTPPGESWAGIRQSVHYDAETGILRYVFGPHEGAGDAGPWSVGAPTEP